MPRSLGYGCHCGHCTAIPKPRKCPFSVMLEKARGTRRRRSRQRDPRLNSENSPLMRGILSARKRIIRELHMSNHAVARVVHEELERRGIRIPATSIYNTIKELESRGKIEKNPNCYAIVYACGPAGFWSRKGQFELAREIAGECLLAEFLLAG